MKRNIIAIAASAIMVISATSAVAQSNVSLEYGVKAGMNFSSLILSDDFQVLESNMKPGADFGGFMRINLHPIFALRIYRCVLHTDQSGQTSPYCPVPLFRPS